MRKIITYILAFVCMLGVASCGKSYKEKQEIERLSRAEVLRQDSLALKIATVPTLDCLPLFVAVDDSLFVRHGVDVHLKQRNAQIDCDTLIRGRHVEGMVSDLIRTERLRKQGLPLRYVTATNAYWKLIANRMARVKEVGQLSDKMIAMTRFSATDYLSDRAVKEARPKPKYDVFRVQINDVNIRLKMVLNNEMDAAMFTEPQATTASLYKNPTLTDSRDKDLRLGVIAFREACWKDKRRTQQINDFIKVYNMACDSLNSKGLQHYAAIIAKYTGADNKTIKALPKLQFTHATPPREKDVQVARNQWK